MVLPYRMLTREESQGYYEEIKCNFDREKYHKLAKVILPNHKSNLQTPAVVDPIRRPVSCSTCWERDIAKN